ncbi:MAG TPA: hypothetical protein DIW17_09200 [Clostridiales bacterium]|nr:hypothetical protein [Clostridiales bacterium]
MRFYKKQSKLTLYLIFVLIIINLGLYIGNTQQGNNQQDYTLQGSTQQDKIQLDWAQPDKPSPIYHTYTIINPYENVDWNTCGQYKANFHAHSSNSDGSKLTRDMVEDHYAKGYNILAVTDHNYLTTSWDKTATGSIKTERKAAIEAGIGRDGRAMIGIDNSNEQSHSDHINSFFASFNNTSGATMANTIQSVEELGGITHINHPGRYTGGSRGGMKGRAASSNPDTVKKYADLFSAYNSCVGMEIVNKIDNQTRSDRVLWDNILIEMMPRGRFVWGFANDDTHSPNATGYAWNVMLLPSLSQSETRISMETGTFYAVSRVSRPDGINTSLPNGDNMPGSGNSSTLYLLEQSTPSISNITVSQTDDAISISISGADYDLIEWIADGKIIATGNTLHVHDYQDQINSYVRAQLRSETGIAFTQPFGIKERILLIP